MLLGGIWKTSHYLYYLISLAALEKHQLSLMRSIIYLKAGEELFFFWSSNSSFPLETNIWLEKWSLREVILLDGNLAEPPHLMTQTCNNMYILMPRSEYQDGLSCKVNIDQHVQCIFPLDQYACFFLNQ